MTKSFLELWKRKARDPLRSRIPSGPYSSISALGRTHIYPFSPTHLHFSLSLPAWLYSFPALCIKIPPAWTYHSANRSPVINWTVKLTNCCSSRRHDPGGTPVYPTTPHSKVRKSQNVIYGKTAPCFWNEISAHPQPRLKSSIHAKVRTEPLFHQYSQL